MKALFEKLTGIILLIVIIGGGQMVYDFIQDRMKSPDQRAQEASDRKAIALELERDRTESVEKYGFYLDCSVKIHGKSMSPKYECEKKYPDK